MVVNLAVKKKRDFYKYAGFERQNKGIILIYLLSVFV